MTPGARQAPPFRARKDSADASGVLAFGQMRCVLLFNVRLEVGADLAEDGAKPVDGAAVEHSVAIFRAKTK